MKTIQSFNEFLNERAKKFDFDSDDYKYDPEYYLENDEDEDEDEEDEADEGDEFSQGLIVPMGDKREQPKPKEKEVNREFYSFEQVADLYDKLKNDELKKSDIDGRAFSALLSIGAIEFHKNEKHLKELPQWYTDYKHGVFGFVKKKGDKKEPMLQIRDDINSFRIFINNAIQANNPAISLTNKFNSF
jgi:hypothetical protein